MNRRRFLAAGAVTLSACATPIGKAQPRLVVVGAGFGGATVAKYVASWDRGIESALTSELNAVIPKGEFTQPKVPIARP